MKRSYSHFHQMFPYRWSFIGNLNKFNSLLNRLSCQIKQWNEISFILSWESLERYLKEEDGEEDWNDNNPRKSLWSKRKNKKKKSEVRCTTPLCFNCLIPQHFLLIYFDLSCWQKGIRKKRKGRNWNGGSNLDITYVESGPFAIRRKPAKKYEKRVTVDEKK